MQQSGHLAEVLCLEQLCVFLLQVADECLLFVDEFVFVVDGFDQHLVVLRESLDSVFELLLCEGEQQFVHVVHAVLQIGHCDYEAVARGEKVHAGNLVAEAVDEGLQEGEFVLLADVGLAVDHQRARVARDQVHAGDQAGVDDAFGFGLGHAFGPQQPDRLAQHPETELLAQKFAGDDFLDDEVVLLVVAALVASDQREFQFRELHFVFFAVAV